MRTRGFTLIELVVVVAILAILVSFAVPAYQEQVRKGRRADAWAALNETAQALERFYTLNNTYRGYTLRDVETQSPRAGDVVYYDIALVAEATAYTLTATPRLADRCGVLSVNSRGVRSSTVTGENGPGAGPSDCAR